MFSFKEDSNAQLDLWANWKIKIKTNQEIKQMTSDVNSFPKFRDQVWHIHAPYSNLIIHPLHNRSALLHR